MERVLDHRARLSVIGQGYVGLTLAATAADAGFKVNGIDSDSDRVRDLAGGLQAVPGVDRATYLEALRGGGLSFSTEPASISQADLIFICVPTPLHDHSPDLSFVESAALVVSQNLRPGCLVTLESTTYPGTTDDLVRPILERSGLRAGEDFLLAYSPERVDPGNDEFGITNTPRIVGGCSPQATEVAVAFYEQIVDKVIAVSSARVAETAKLLENTFRHVNIALVNELAMLCHELGMDVWEVIDAAATKPFGFMPFFPGPGVGGHCIPLDPTYLSWQVHRDAGRRFGVLEQAQDVNDRMPNWVASRVGEILNDRGMPVRGSKILVLGVTYKSDVGDVRESPSLRAMQGLHRKGAQVSFHDFYIDRVAFNGRFEDRVPDLETAVAEADCVVLLAPHRAYDLEMIADRAKVIFDTRNAYGSARRANVVPL